MPIVVDPGFQWPPETDPVVSPDGRITAIVDPAHAGVLLRANFDDSVPDTPAVPEKVLRRNLAAGFGETLNGWAGSSSLTPSIVSGAGEFGLDAVRLTVGSSPAANTFFYKTAGIPISPGGWAGFGASVKNNSGNPFFALRILFYNSSNATVGSSPYVADAVKAGDGYVRVFGSAQAPATAVGYRAYIYLRETAVAGAPLAGQSVLVSSWSNDVAGTQAAAADSVAGFFNGTKQYGKLLRRNLARNPLGPSMSSVGSIRKTDDLSVVQDGGRPVLQMLENGGSTSFYLDQADNFAPPVGTKVHFAAEVKVTEDISALMRIRLATYNSAATSNATGTPNLAQLVSQGWVSHDLESTILEMPSSGYTRAIVYPGTGASAFFSTGKGILVKNYLIEYGTKGPFFDGNTASTSTRRYAWDGTPNDSSSGEYEMVPGVQVRRLADGTSEMYTPAKPFIPGKPGTVAQVRFERQDGSLVRSGNPAWAPGGYAHAYDHEARLGGGSLWRAVPIRFDGTEGTPSEYVGAVIPGLTDGWAWLKPVADPNKAMLLRVEPPDLSYDGRVDTTSIAGAARPAATWDVLEGFTTQLRSLVREKDVEEQLMGLLDEGPVLAQFPACAGLPDFYFIRGKVGLEHVHWDGWPWRRYQWDVTQIDRPDTTDSPLRIPDLSYDTVARDWTTYDQLKSTVVSYNKLLEP